MYFDQSLNQEPAKAPKCCKISTVYLNHTLFLALSDRVLYEAPRSSQLAIFDEKHGFYQEPNE